MGELIYKYGAERFGFTEERKKSSTIPTKSRRQQEIDRLVKERRLLKQQWRKALEEEKEGINLLQAENTSRLSTLRRAENLRRRRKSKEHARSSFFKDPFKFVKSLFTKEKSGKLKTSRKDLEAHLKRTHTDSHRGKQRTLPSDMPPIHPPEHQLDVDPPKWSEVERTVRRGRAASSPGPNGVPYRLYKNAPEVLRFLWRLMKVVWQKHMIPTAWRRAGGILIPKEKDAEDISQFRHISLLNVEGKIFFSVLQAGCLPREKQVHRHNSAESRDSRLLGLLGAHKHDMASDPSRQKGARRSPRRVLGPRQRLWFCSS